MSNFFPQKKFAGLGGAQQGVGLAPHRRSRPGGEQVKKQHALRALTPIPERIYSPPPLPQTGSRAKGTVRPHLRQPLRSKAKSRSRTARLSPGVSGSLCECFHSRELSRCPRDGGLAFRHRSPAASPFGFGRRRFARLSPRFACRKSGRRACGTAPCLRRGRRTFSFVMVYRSQSSERFLTVFAAPVGLAPDVGLCPTPCWALPFCSSLRE